MRAVSIAPRSKQSAVREAGRLVGDAKCTLDEVDANMQNTRHMGPAEHSLTLAPRYFAVARRLIERERATIGDERTAAIRTLEKMFAKLAALVGTLGLLALFARSVTLSRSSCTSLATLAVDPHSLETTRTQLRAHFAALPEDAEDGATLVATFVSLVATFIGEELTLQLIDGEDESST